MSAPAAFTGPCEDCCTCPEAAVQWDSRSKSLTKVGFPEFIVSSPPKIYLRAEITGGTQFVSLDTNGSGNPLLACGGPGNLIAGSGPVEGATEYDADGSGSLVEDSTACDAALNSPCAGVPQTVPLQIRAFDLGVGGPPNHYCAIASQHIWEDGGWVHNDCFDTGDITATSSTAANIQTGGTDATATLSKEYLTATLKTNTVAALPAYDDDWNDTAGSYANLSDDELTYTARESRYRLRFKIPLVGFGTCYKVTWVERFTPEGGGAVTDTERCDIWDGTTPPGYDPDDSATWPVLPSASPYYYELPVPSADGTTTVVSVVAECVDCSACP